MRYFAKWITLCVKTLGEKSLINTDALSEPTDDRWTALVERIDCNAIWNAIDWSGSVLNDSICDKPSISDFKSHFENLNSY